MTPAFTECYPLTLSSTVTGGSATKTPPNSVGCAAHWYVASAAVTVTASPSTSAHTFAQWSGSDSRTSSSIVFTIPAAPVSLVPTFAACLSLTVSGVGAGGSVALSPPMSGTCASGNFVSGASVSAVATAASGYGFGGWSGVSAGSAATASFIMPTIASTLTASFRPCYALNLATTVMGGTASASLENSPICALGTYEANAAFTVTATASSGYTFSKWSGASSSDVSSISFTMPSGPASLTPSFAECLLLTVAGTDSSGSVALSPTQSGTCALGRFVSGASVSATATPAAAYGFSSWSGTATGSAVTVSFSMPTSDSTLTAAFTPCHLLTIGTATGGSAVASIPNSPICTVGRYVAGATFTVTATTSGNYAWDKWSGGSSSTTAALSYTMPNAAATLTPAFNQCFLLALSAGAGGGATKSPPQSTGCVANRYISAATVTLTASPITGYTFDAWSGGSVATTPVISYNMPAADTSVAAVFAQCHLLSLTTSVTGGSASVNPISSGGCMTGTYLLGTSITATATASNGYAFKTWTGVTTSTSSSATFTMPAGGTSIAPTFNQCFALTVTTVAGVSMGRSLTQSTGCAAGSYISGTSVTLTATVLSGYVWNGWTGGSTSSSLSISLTTTAGSATYTPTVLKCYALAFRAPQSSGYGTKSPDNSPGCPLDTYLSGTTITAHAVPEVGFAFSRWVGASTAATESITFDMPASDVPLEPVFGYICFQLAVPNSAFGTVTRSAVNTGTCPTNYYRLGFSVTLTAVPNSGYKFTGWTGDLTGATNPVTYVTKPAAQTIGTTWATV